MWRLKRGYSDRKQRDQRLPYISNIVLMGFFVNYTTILGLFGIYFSSSLLMADEPTILVNGG